MASIRRSGRGEGAAPALIGGLALVAVAFLALPPVALALRAPWHAAAARLSDPAVFDALRLSLVVSTAALALSLAFGAPLAWVLARASLPGLAVVRALVIVPMVLPPVVAGVALLTAFGRRGVAGAALERLGLTLPFSTTGAAVAAAFVSAPFLVVALEAGLRSAGRDLEDAAATLGASRARILWTVTLPSVAPSVAAGAALCWARALGEFGATVTFAGNLRGRTQTAPLAVYEELQTGDPDGAVLVSLVLLAISVAVVAALRGRLFAR